MLSILERLFLFLTIFLLPTQLGRHFWPNFSFVYSLPIDYLSPTVYFWDLVVFILVALFIFQDKVVNRTALNLLFIFILAQAVSLLPVLLSSPINLGGGLVRLEQYLIAGLFGVYLASSRLKTVATVIFWALSLAIITQSALAIYQFLTGTTFGLWILGERTFSLSTPGIAKFDYLGQQFLRPYATFPHPNVLAAFMVISALLLNWLKLDDFKKNLISGVSILVASITALLTVSRVVLIAGALSLTAYLNKKGRALLFLAVLLLSPILYTRFSATFSFDNLSLLRREELSEVAFNLFLSHFLFGVGLNNFISIASEQLLIGPSRFLQPVHNIYLLSLAETGVVGFLGLALPVSFVIWKLFRNRSDGSKKLLFIWSVILFLGLFDHYFLTLPQGYRLLFVIWGLSLSYTGDVSKK